MPSRRVAEKAGAYFEGIARNRLMHFGALREAVLYLCNYFNCRVEQLVEHVPDSASPVTTRKKKTASRRSR